MQKNRHEMNEDPLYNEIKAACGYKLPQWCPIIRFSQSQLKLPVYFLNSILFDQVLKDICMCGTVEEP